MSKAPSEKHLEDWIVNNWKLFGEEIDVDGIPDHHVAGWEYLPLKGISETYPHRYYVSPFYSELIAQQFKLPSGIPDLIAGGGIWGKLDQLCVIELKRGPITYKSVGQCARYLYEIGEIFQHINMATEGYYLSPFDCNINTGVGLQWSTICGMLVGHGMEDENIPLVAAQSKIAVVDYDFSDPYYIFREVYEMTEKRDEYRNFGPNEVTIYLHNLLQHHRKKELQRREIEQYEALQERSSSHWGLS